MVTLNDNILELQQKNVKLVTNLKHVMDQQQQQEEQKQQLQQQKLISKLNPTQKANTLPNTSKILLGRGNKNALDSNQLTMEDEEGEIFDNTYLTDLKTGRYPKDIGYTFDQ